MCSVRRSQANGYHDGESYFASKRRQFIFKVNDRNTLTRHGVRSDLTIIKTPKQRQLIVIVLASLLLTLNMLHILLFDVSIAAVCYNLTRDRDARIKTFFIRKYILV